MLFNTISYVCFLTLAAAGFWLLPPSRRTWFVLAASVLFYALWRVEFVLLISFSAFVDYYFSLKIFDEERQWYRKLFLVLSIGTNLSLLLYFKYTYFLTTNLSAIGEIFGQNWSLGLSKIVLPLGISFYTFLSISYTLDVYRRLFTPVRNFGTYLTYVMFWPHMIAGPILRAHELIPQLVRSGSFNIEKFSEGIRRILFGLFLKVALADQIAPYVNEAFLSSPRELSALDVWTMAFAFGLQIYFDFAGYSMIAIGSAGLLGIYFPENFNWPYLAVSPRDFWRRWHITLSSWIRDYLYLPLSGVAFKDQSEGGLDVGVLRASSVRLTIALFLSWFLMGLWHGAAWTFALWGVWHGTFIWLYRLSGPTLDNLPRIVRRIGGWAITLAVTMLSWIPFRARSLGDAFALLGRVFDVHAYGHLAFRENFYLVTAVLFTGMLVFRAAEIVSLRIKPPLWGQVAEVGVLAFAAIVVFIFLRPVEQFIYFQF